MPVIHIMAQPEDVNLTTVVYILNTMVVAVAVDTVTTVEQIHTECQETVEPVEEELEIIKFVHHRALHTTDKQILVVEVEEQASNLEVLLHRVDVGHLMDVMKYLLHNILKQLVVVEQELL